MDSILTVLDDEAAVAQRAAEWFVSAVQAARSPTAVCLSGGSTPRALYRLLADEPYRARLPWNAIHFYWGDERHVPPDHADSNYRMAREAMLDHVPVPAAHVHRIAGEEPVAAAAAAAYERELIAHFALRADRDGGAQGNGAAHADGGAHGNGGDGGDGSAMGAGDATIDWPRFDVLLLGLGEEGHTASLFPGSPALGERRHLVAAPWVEAHQTYRITLTPPALNHAATVIFLVSGAAKAAALAGVLEGTDDGATGAAPQRLQYPAQIIAPVDGRLLWLVDLPAAARLR